MNDIVVIYNGEQVSVSREVADYLEEELSMISSKVDCGIFSIFEIAASKYITGAKRKLPLAMLAVRSLPAKS